MYAVEFMKNIFLRIQSEIFIEVIKINHNHDARYPLLQHT